jgi:ADP-ribose pyrophosphatase
MTDRSRLEETCLDRESLFDGVLLKVFRDRVELPDGEESVREWIDHPGAAAVVPLFEDRSTVLLRQFRYPAGEVFVEVPAGKFDEVGEDPEGLARRELEEETGWRANRFTHLGGFYPCIGYSNEIIHFFLARDLSRGRATLEEEEFVEPFRVPFDEALAMVRRGEIRDMKTMVALLLAADALKEG